MLTKNVYDQKQDYCKICLKSLCIGIIISVVCMVFAYHVFIDNDPAAKQELCLIPSGKTAMAIINGIKAKITEHRWAVQLEYTKISSKSNNQIN